MARRETIAELTARLEAERQAKATAKQAMIDAAGRKLRASIAVRTDAIEAERQAARAELAGRQAEAAALDLAAYKNGLRSGWIANGGTPEAFEAAWPEMERRHLSDVAADHARERQAQTARTVLDFWNH